MSVKQPPPPAHRRQPPKLSNRRRYSKLRVAASTDRIRDARDYRLQVASHLKVPDAQYRPAVALELGVDAAIARDVRCDLVIPVRS
jgi:hypothetical protein